MRCPSSVRSREPATAWSLAVFRSSELTRLPVAVRGAFPLPLLLPLFCMLRWPLLCPFGLIAGVGRDALLSRVRFVVVFPVRFFVDCVALVFAIPESSAPVPLSHNPRRRWRTSRCARGRDARGSAPGARTTGRGG